MLQININSYTCQYVYSHTVIISNIVFQIQAANGEVTITNDGATILKLMSVIHPAAKMVNIAHI